MPNVDGRDDEVAVTPLSSARKGRLGLVAGAVAPRAPEALEHTLRGPWPIEPRTAREPLAAGAVDALVIDLDSLDGDEARLLSDALTRAPATPPLVAVSSDLRPSILRTLLKAHRLRHIAQLRDEPSQMRRLEGTLARLVGAERSGLATYLGEGARVFRIGLVRTEERAAALDAVSAEAAARGVSRRVRQVVLSALDELIMNALYDAPVDAHGDFRCASWPRTCPVCLAEGERIDVFYGSDGARFGISVLDRFGSLRPERVQDEVARWLGREQLVVREGPGGAGIGLQEVLDVLEHLVVDLQPGLHTEIIGLFDARGGFRRIRESSKSVDIFVKEGSE